MDVKLWTLVRITKNSVSQVGGKAITAMFRNHVYTYRSSLYKQTKGGGIGLRLTGVVESIVMENKSTFTNGPAMNCMQKIK